MCRIVGSVGKFILMVPCFDSKLVSVPQAHMGIWLSCYALFFLVGLGYACCSGALLPLSFVGWGSSSVICSDAVEVGGSSRMVFSFVEHVHV